MTDAERRAGFDLCWDGAHHDCDADLLSAGLDRIVDKRAAPSVNPKRHDAAALVATVLRLHRTALTMREVATFAGVGDLIANGGLYTLGQQGKLGHRERVGTWMPRLGRPVREYWLLPEAG